MADLQVVVKDNVLVVSFPDSELMDEERNREIGAELVQLAKQAPDHKMLISFDGVEFVTSSMLGQLVMVNRRCQGDDVILKICEVGTDLRTIFRIVRLDTLVEICGDEASALASFQSDDGPAFALDNLGSADDHREAAEAGDAAAQFRLGKCYEEGLGVEQDFPKALEWFKTSADLSYAASQHMLGTCYAYGMQVPQDYQLAFQWFQKAAEQGHAGAQYMLGMRYANGLGEEQDDKLAAKWFGRAAEAGDVEAQMSLADAYREGRGVPQDLAKAVDWYRRAAECGHSGARQTLEGLDSQ